MVPARSQEQARQQPLSDDEKRQIIEQFRQRAAQEHDKVVALGGLHMLGTERHEARRIDNQLRGRCGRQGDPGSSRFYLSFQDDLMRIFGSDRIAKLMEFKWFQWEEGLPIEHPWVTKSIETAQRRVEGQNFDARKHLLEYDNVMNRQREVIYEQRRRILEGIDLKGLVDGIIEELAEELVETYAPKDARPDAWDRAPLQASLTRQFGVAEPFDISANDREALLEQLIALLTRAYAAKEQLISEGLMRQLERSVLLAVVDAKWKDHLYMMDALREGIGLRAYGQRDPLVEYQHEAYAMFRDMVASVKADSLAMLLRVQPAAQAQPVSVFARTPHREVHEERSGLPPRPPEPAEGARRDLIDRAVGPSRQPPQAPAVAVGPKVGRNDPCPCRSGLKYKKCHGK
ncbi:MAG TPA: hypothetical protein DD714_06250 [Candidatus Omnitrophica bacterium]|nr:hypothetical protein [Candidatus Omnitrophota bacterium]